MNLVADKRRFFLRATTLQALAEAWFLGMGALLGLTFNFAGIGSETFTRAIILTIPMVALWDAVRLRIPDEPGLAHHLWYEVRAALALSPLAAGLWLWVLQALGRMPVFGETPFGSFGGSLAILAVSPFFLACRFGVRTWLYWGHLRRRRLVWALTNIQVQLVLAVAILGALVLSTISAALGEQALWRSDTWIFTIFSVLGVAGVMTLVAIAAILPPGLFFSWLTARRTTRRLEALAKATGALRRGEYSTRIAVEGEDEVAQLQGDFNAMAAALEQAVHDLAAERDKVSELLDVRRQLVANVSHELRTPVATLRGYLESLRDHPNGLELQGETTEGASRLQHDLATMENEVARLQRLIDDLLTLSQVEVGGLALDIRLTDLGEIIRRQVDAAGRLAWQRERVRIVADVPEGLPRAMADPDRFEQVLANLLRNALRHTPPGGIVAVSAGTEAGRIWVRVCDTGEGIPPEEQARIWERFYRGDGARVRDPNGAGLGLALVKELVEAMAGSVTLESEVGAGSRFTVRLSAEACDRAATSL